MPTEKEFLAKKALLDTKQDKLVAGTNIQIDPVTNRISAINDAEIIDVQVNGQSVLGVDKIARVNVDTVEPNPTSTPTDTLTSVDINGTIYELQGGGGNADYIELTQAEYNALTPAEKNNGKMYFITDGESEPINIVTNVIVNGVSVVTNKIASFSVPEIEANPSDTATDTLNKVDIDGTIYEIQGGGGTGNVDDVYVNGESVLDSNHIAQITSYKTLSQAEYDALPQSKLTDGVLYCIEDSGIVEGNQFAPIIYSTEERVIGTWTDGKPLYQKTLSKTLTSINDYIDLVDIDDIDTFVNAKGAIRYAESNFNQDVVIPCYLTTSYYLRIYYISNAKNNLGNNYPDNQVLFFETTNDFIRYYRNFFVTIYYTKVDDVAGSGKYNSFGVPTHHYSTDEQVVGTWIDGSTLYEKTVTVNFTIRTSAQDITSIMDFTGIKQFVSFIGFYTGSGEEGIFPISAYKYNNKIFARSIEDAVIDHVTIQYTKTT